MTLRSRARANSKSRWGWSSVGAALLVAGIAGCGSGSDAPGSLAASSYEDGQVYFDKTLLPSGYAPVEESLGGRAGAHDGRLTEPPDSLQSQSSIARVRKGNGQEIVVITGIRDLLETWTSPEAYNAEVTLPNMDYSTAPVDGSMRSLACDYAKQKSGSDHCVLGFDTVDVNPNDLEDVVRSVLSGSTAVEGDEKFSHMMGGAPARTIMAANEDGNTVWITVTAGGLPAVFADLPGVEPSRGRQGAEAFTWSMLGDPLWVEARQGHVIMGIGLGKQVSAETVGQVVGSVEGVGSA